MNVFLHNRLQYLVSEHSTDISKADINEYKVRAKFLPENNPGIPLHQLHMRICRGLRMKKETILAGMGTRMEIVKLAQVGSSVACPSCNTLFTKSSYQHSFCKDKVPGKSNCKDFFHNTISSNDSMFLAETPELDIIATWLKSGRVTESEIKRLCSHAR